VFHRLRPAGTGAAILCYACLSPATPATDEGAPPAALPAADAPVAVRRPMTVGILPVTSNIDPSFAPLRGVTKASLDAGLADVPGLRLVDRSQVSGALDELVLDQRNRDNLRVGRFWRAAQSGSPLRAPACNGN
jgi:hypothetical protein